MPELPEVERTRRSLEPHLLGATITRATLRRRDICTTFRGDTGSTRGRTLARDLLAGAHITTLARRGKQLALIAGDQRTVIIQLGMTGQVLFVPRGGTPRQPDHIHAEWRIARDSGEDLGRILFRDPRRFGELTTYESPAAVEAHRWARLGPDALDTPTPDLAAALGLAIAGSQRAIKAALLDQGVIAGVGNIYADEALFLARIDPRRLCLTLTPADVAALAARIREVLERSVALGGSTLRDYVDADGRRGTTQLTHAVYARAGQPCITCGATLTGDRLAQRATVWCPACQR